MLLPAFLGLLTLAALPVQVESAACPTGAEVEQALQGLLPPVPATRARDVAHVVRVDRNLRIELVDADGAVLAERSLFHDGTCADRASLVAVVIASWESDVHPEFARTASGPAALDVAKPSAQAPPLPVVQSASYDVAVGAVASLAGAFAPGSALRLGWIPRGSGPGVHVFVEGDGSRTVALGVGQASWRRWMGGAELDWRVDRGASSLDFHGGLALAWLDANGLGFSTNRSAQSFSPGATVGVRWSWWVLRHFAPFAEVGAIYWLRNQSVYSPSDATERELPHFQAVASIGLLTGKASVGR